MPVAIVLNTNARSVTKSLIPLAQRVLGQDAVFLTTNAEEAQQAARELIQHNTSLVIPVGGDGTLSSLVNFMTKEVRANNPSMSMEEAMEELPVFGYIPMGTGNGVGSVVGCKAPLEGSSNPSLWKRIFRRKRLKQEQFTNVLKLLRTVGEELHQGYAYDSLVDKVDRVNLPMMELTTSGSTPQNGSSRGDLCFFAGVGFDSLLLADFKDLKAWSQRRQILPGALGSVAGYCVALVCKTLPKCIQRNAHQVQVTISSRDPDTLWVDHRRGDVVQALENSLVYNGTAGIVAAGTSPFYGGGLRLFPFARLSPSKMHLRVGRIHPLTGFFNIPRIFAGSYRDLGDQSFGCLDFLGDDFDISVQEQTQVKVNGKRVGYPLQHSGESIGSYEAFRLKVVKTPLKFVTFLKKRIVQDFVI
jgi:diacylglycerol kinase family enzyme